MELRRHQITMRIDVRQEAVGRISQPQVKVIERYLAAARLRCAPDRDGGHDAFRVRIEAVEPSSVIVIQDPDGRVAGDHVTDAAHRIVGAECRHRRGGTGAQGGRRATSCNPQSGEQNGDATYRAVFHGYLPRGLCPGCLTSLKRVALMRAVCLILWASARGKPCQYPYI